MIPQDTSLIRFMIQDTTLFGHKPDLYFPFKSMENQLIHFREKTVVTLQPIDNET